MSPRLHGCMRLVLLLLVAASLGAQRPRDWTLTPELRIGPDRGEEYEFTRIVAVVPGPGGTLHVAEATTHNVRVFDLSGNLVRTIGRRGAGPGEFNAVAGLGFIADTMWVVDAALRRVSLFARDGKFLQAVQRDAADPAPIRSDEFFFVSVAALLPNGLAIGRGSHAASMLAAGKVRSSPLLLLTRGGRTIDTIAHVAIKNSQMSFAMGDRQSFSIQRFSDSPLSIIAPSAGRVFIVDRSVATSARDARFRVTALDVKGDTLWSHAYSYAPRRLSSGSVDSALDNHEQSFAKMGSPVTRAQIRAQLFAPEYRTPVAAGFAADDGSLWLKREDGAANVEYGVISPKGDLVGRVVLNRKTTLRAATASHVWAVETDADDVPVIVRYRITQ